jgi:hypothetical protein
VKTTFARTLTEGRIPLVVKLLYTAFVCVLVPQYWKAYGPTNFLYFCDIALLMTVPALWLESPLLLSMPAVGITVPQLLWQIDFLSGLFGKPVIGMTAYMFDSNKDLYLRGLSFFHFWLPLLLLYAVGRVGYDRRAFVCWTVLATILMLICYFLMPVPPPPESNPNLPVNINYVYGLHDDQPPQTWMTPLAWLGLILAGLPLCLYLPTHLVFKRIFRSPSSVYVSRIARNVNSYRKRCVEWNEE